MVHFDFVMPDVDAEFLMDIIHSRIKHNLVEMIAATANNETSLIAAYKRENAYVEQLIKNMLNKRVDNL